MDEQTVWQPKDDQENAILAAANHLLRFGHPPVGERLCRRVPAPQGVSVPYPIRSVLDAALIVYITECRQVYDPDGETLARQAQQWLDSQRPAPGQGGNDE